MPTTGGGDPLVFALGGSANEALASTLMSGRSAYDRATRCEAPYPEFLYARQVVVRSSWLSDRIGPIALNPGMRLAMSPRCARFGIACVLRPVALPLLLLLAACDEGSVSLAVTDAPADEVEAVVVQFVAVEFRNSEGDWERVEFDRDLQVDLLALRGSAQTLIRDESIPAAQYTAIRFEIEADGDTGESYVDEDDGSRIALELAAGQDSKPTVDYRFNLDEGDEISLTVDFDLRRSLREPENFDDPYLLESFLRAVEDERTGTLRGSVSNDLLGSGCEAALYVFEGQDAEPDDLGGANEPLTSQALVIDNGSVSVSYEIAFLEAGDYTLALTCEAEDDELDEDDDLSFRRERNFEIEEGEVTELDLD